MKTIIKFVIVLLFVFGFYLNSYAQGIQFISGKCPTTRTYGSVTVQRDGNINLIPCAGQDVLINGVPIPSGGAIGGTGTATFFPVFTAAQTIGNSPYLWNGTDYVWNNTALNGVFTMNLEPSATDGNFSVGDVTNSTVFFRLDGTADTAELKGNVVEVGDVDGVSNLTLFTLNDSSQTMNFTAGTTVFAIDGVANTSQITDGLSIRYRDAVPVRNALEIRNSANTVVAHLNAITNRNLAIGFNAGNLTTTGSNNLFLGRQAGQANTTGLDNTFIGGNGSGTLNTTGASNVFVGSVTGGANTTGGLNTFIGNAAGELNVSGSENVFIGTQSGGDHTSGNQNTFIGVAAGEGNLTGAGNVFIGFDAGSNETGDNLLYIDNSNTATPLIFGNFATNALTTNGSHRITGDVAMSKTITPAGTTGNIIANTTIGNANLAAAATSLTVTNSLVSATSLIFLTPQTADGTCIAFAITGKGAGSFTITANAACTAETSIAFMVIN